MSIKFIGGFVLQNTCLHEHLLGRLVEVAFMMVVHILDFDKLEVSHSWGQKISSLKGSISQAKVHFATYILFSYIAKIILSFFNGLAFLTFITKKF